MAQYSRRTWLLAVSLFALASLCASVLLLNFLSMFLEPIGSIAEDGVTKKLPDDTVDVYIPGAGFSGFFYTLGRLQALHDHSATPHHEYYCFSAGCLALVTSILGIPIDRVITLAHAARDQWVSGQIGRYDVVEYFVDGLLSDTSYIGHSQNDTNCVLDGTSAETWTGAERGIDHSRYPRNADNLQNQLPRINVITSEWHRKHFMPSAKMQQPSSLDSLRKMLVQTTWIPLVTGQHFGHVDEAGMYQNDGAFAGLLRHFSGQSTHQHRFQPNRHHHSMLMPWNIDLVSNALNMLMSYDRAIEFWTEGREHGI